MMPSEVQDLGKIQFCLTCLSWLLGWCDAMYEDVNDIFFIYLGTEEKRMIKCIKMHCYFCRSRNMQCQKLFQANAPINCVCLHPNQAAVVVGDQTGALHLWDLVRDTSSKVVCSTNMV